MCAHVWLLQFLACCMWLTIVWVDTNDACGTVSGHLSTEVSTPERDNRTQPASTLRRHPQCYTCASRMASRCIQVVDHRRCWRSEGLVPGMQCCGEGVQRRTPDHNPAPCLVIYLHLYMCVHAHKPAGLLFAYAYVMQCCEAMRVRGRQVWV